MPVQCSLAAHSHPRSGREGVVVDDGNGCCCCTMMCDDDVGHVCAALAMEMERIGKTSRWLSGQGDGLKIQWKSPVRVRIMLAALVSNRK